MDGPSIDQSIPPAHTYLSIYLPSQPTNQPTTRQISHIFVKNREKLEAYLMKLGRPRRGGDEEEEDQKAFEEEKEMIIERLRELEVEEHERED